MLVCWGCKIAVGVYRAHRRHVLPSRSTASRALAIAQISADVRMPADACATAFERRRYCAHRAAGL
eukprot:11290-Heterococcus_DN1.PRE.3